MPRRGDGCIFPVGDAISIASFVLFRKRFVVLQQESEKKNLNQVEHIQYKRRWLPTAIFFLASQTISLFGSMIVSYSITWQLTLRTSSGKVMMISVLCTCLPHMVVSLFGGVWADRYNRKALIVGADLFIAVATLVLAGFLFNGYQSLWMIYFVLCVRSAGQGVQTPAVQAILPQIVPQEKLTRFNGINSTLNSMITLVSPAVGGLILTVMGFNWSLLVDVVTAAFAIVIMLALRIKTHERIATKLTLWQDMKQGILYAKGHKVVSAELLFFAFYILLMSPAIFLTPLLVERTFGSEVWYLTANELAWSVGTLIGGVSVSIWGGWKNQFTTMAFGAVWFGLTFALMGFATSFPFYLSMMLIAGLFMPLMGTASTVLIQEVVEQQYLGRVFSLWSIISNLVAPASMLVYGPLADKIPVQWLMIGSGAALMLLGGVVFRKRALADPAGLKRIITAE